MNDQLAKVMKHSLVEMPFSDFDQRMMLQIRKEAIALERAKKDKSSASTFFMLGCFFGTCCSGVVAFSKDIRNIEGVDLKSVWHASAVILLFLFLNSFYHRFFKKSQHFKKN
jgi:hypothetical protein